MLVTFSYISYVVTITTKDCYPSIGLKVVLATLNVLNPNYRKVNRTEQNLFVYVIKPLRKRHQFHAFGFVIILLLRTWQLLFKLIIGIIQALAYSSIPGWNRFSGIRPGLVWAGPDFWLDP